MRGIFLCTFYIACVAIVIFVVGWLWSTTF